MRYSKALSLAVLLAACGSDDVDDGVVSLAFEARFGAEAAQCGTVYDGLGTANSSAQLKDLRFYVSSVRLIAADGSEVPLVLDVDDTYQTDTVALLDFEDGSGLCAGDAATNTKVTGSVPPGTYTGLAFDVAVPFALNHQDMPTSAAPLNAPGMFWAWGIGRKFLRLDLDVAGSPWNIHLGSTMCPTPDMMTAPSGECARPNRATIRLTEFDHRADAVVLDVASWLASSDLTTNTDNTAFGCQSFPGDPECTAIFSSLGMSYDTGGCVSDCGGQVAFSRQ